MALSLEQIKAVFGDPLAGKPPAPKPDGSLITDMGWWHANITVIRLPYGPGHVFRCPCHRLIAPHLRAVFEDLARRSLTYLVETIDGCEVSRMMRGSQTQISRHTFGIPIDINAAKYPQGSFKKQDPRLVSAFERHGFKCGQIGGDLWTHPAKWDPMHFEFCDLSLLDRSLLLSPGGPAIKLPDISIMLPGHAQPLAGTIAHGALHGPVREIVESLGGRLDWNNEKKRAVIRKG